MSLSCIGPLVERGFLKKYCKCILRFLQLFSIIHITYKICVNCSKAIGETKTICRLLTMQGSVPHPHIAQGPTAVLMSQGVVWRRPGQEVQGGLCEEGKTQ